MVGQESELVCSVTEVVLVWGLCVMHKLHRDGLQCNGQQLPGVFSISVA